MHATLQASLRAAVRARRDVQSVGPFLAAFDPDSDSPFRNYAVPDDDACPTYDEIVDLRGAFVGRGRVPRLEFLPAAAPAAEAALVRAGFVTDDRLPIMTCAPAQLTQPTPPPGVTLDIALASNALRQAAAIQNAAYGAPVPTPADVARLERTVAAGGVVGLAHIDGEAIASGLIAAPGGRIAELAAVGVVPAWRRRGVASALTGALSRAAFDSGVAAVMLMAHEAEQPVYARAGFSVASEIIFMSVASVPDTSPT